MHHINLKSLNKRSHADEYLKQLFQIYENRADAF